MHIALELTLILALAALAAGLVPLLFQLRRTAQGLDAFLLSSRRDLSQIAEDVHASRSRMDHLTASLQTPVDELSAFTQLMGKARRAAADLLARFQDAIASASRNPGGAIGGIRAVLAFFNRTQTRHEPEPEKRP